MSINLILLYNINIQIKNQKLYDYHILKKYCYLYILYYGMENENIYSSVNKIIKLLI